MHITQLTLKKSLLLLLWVVSAVCVSAQNLNGEKVKVSPESITALKFNSTIMDYQWSDPSGYTCIARNNDNTLLIKTLINDPAATTLIVSEGKRTHYFIIDFIPKININETKLYYDYSDLKQLKKLVQNSNAIAINDVKKEVEKEELSSKEKKKLEKEKEAQQLAAQEKRKEEEAERQKLADEQKKQVEKIKEQERAEEQKREQEEAERTRIANEKKQKEDEEREQKEKARLEAIAKEQEKIKAEEEKQKQLAAAKEAERQRKAEEEAARIKKLNDEKEAIAAAEKEKKRLEAEKQKQLAEEKERLRKEKEREKQLAALKEQQRKEEEKQKQLAKIEEEKRRQEAEEQAKKEAERNKTSYTHTELWKKYPNIVFGDPPPLQYLTGEYYVPKDTLENHRIASRLIDMDYWLNISSEEVGGVTITLQSMIFSGVNSYLRIIIKNNSDKDFLGGRMNLKWMKNEGANVDLFPCYLTEFPIVLPHKEKTIVYAARAVNADDKDKFIFNMTDRFEKTNLEFKFSGTAYNLEMSK